MKKHYHEIFGYYYNQREIDMLYHLASGKQCVLEIGSFLGKSSVALAMAAKHVVCVDTFQSNNLGSRQTDQVTTLDGFLQNIEGYDNIEYHIGKSIDIIPEFDDDLFDMVFIDGDHSLKGCSNDIYITIPKAKSNCLWVFHDYGAPVSCDGLNCDGVKKSVDFFFGKLDGLETTLAWVTENGTTKRV